MLFISPYEARLLAEERAKDGVRRAQKNRYIKAIRQGRNTAIAGLIERMFSPLAPSTGSTRSRNLPAVRNLR